MSKTSCPAASSDEAAGSGDGGEWLSAAEIARRRGLDRSTTSRRIAKFAEANLLEVRDGAGSARRYSLAAFDAASAANLDLARSLAATQRQPKPAAAQEDDDDDRVILLSDFSNSVRGFLTAVSKAIDILPACANEIAASVSREHVHEVIRRVHAEMHAAVKEAADNARVRAYKPTPKGRADWGLPSQSAEFL